MNDLLARWFEIPAALRSEAWHFTVARSWPLWVLVLATVSIVAVAWWSYAGLRGSRMRRAGLACLRMITLALALVLWMGPAVEWPRERQERDLVQVLVDRSASMQVRDALQADGSRSTRDQELRRMLQDPVWTELGRSHAVTWLGMTGRLSPVTDPAAPGPADGRRTLVAGALQQALREAGARPLAAVVLVTDGRSQDQPDASLLRALKASGAPVFPVALGDPAGAQDRGIAQVEHPRRAFPRDAVPVQVTVSGGGTGSVRVALRDRADGRVLDERTVELDADRRARVTLTGRRVEAGEADWEVTLLPAGQDADPSNDTRPVQVTFIDRPLRVLYVDGWPRWEFRYLKNLLLREEGVESSVMLLSADRDFAQEGTAPLARLPVTDAEFSAFDVIVIGDVPGGFLDDARQKALRELVGRRGAGLLWIGGERATPNGWHGMPMEDLLPFRGGTEIGRWDEPVVMTPTPLATRLGLLELGEQGRSWPQDLTRAGPPWSRLEWAQRIDPKDLKPAVETWAMAESGRASSSATPRPLVLSMRFGAGQVAYVGTDETWRWRHGQGETLPERFWIQIIRHLARQALRGASERPTLEAEPSLVAVEQPTRISVDASGQPQERLVVEARHGDDADVVEIELRPDGRGRLGAAWSPPREGVWTVRAPGSGWGEVRVQARSEDPETLETLPDHGLLQRLADATGGRMIQPSEVSSLSSLVPSRSITVRQPVQWPLWQRWPAYLLLLSLLLAEWLGRRTLRLP